jgi:putative membrane protein
MPNSSTNLNENIITTKKNREFSFLRWSLIAVVFILYASLLFAPHSPLGGVARPVGALCICLLAFMHGFKRYRFRNMAIFFIVTWIVSNSFEALSIYMGFPFGNYHYTMGGPRILEVPLLIMPAYFGMGYMAWTLSNILNGQNGKRLKGVHVFLVPLIASFTMVMWDVVMDPIAATVGKVWIWEDGGSYFNVPISNYLGWFLVVYIFLQIFSIYISRYDMVEKEDSFNKTFWFEASIVYGLQGLSFIGQSLVETGNREIYSSMGLVCVFTMIFVSILSAITLYNSNELRYINDKSNIIKSK